MKKSFFKEIAAPALSLFLIGAVCTLLLALTDSATSAKIAENSKKTEEKSMASAVPEAVGFSEKIVTEDYTYYEAYGDGNTVTAYVFVTSANGYGGELTVMTGIDTEGFITGVIPLKLNETAGLGMKAKNDSFLSQYEGKTEGISVNKSSPGDNEIQALTGATITSKAVTAAVNAAFDGYKLVKEGQ